MLLYEQILMKKMLHMMKRIRNYQRLTGQIIYIINSKLKSPFGFPNVPPCSFV